MLHIFAVLAYHLMFLLCLGLFILRIIKGSFLVYLKEEVGLITIFIMLSLAINVSTILKGAYSTIILLVLIGGYFFSKAK